DRYGDMPDASAHEELALDLYRAMLRDVGEYDYTPGSPLGQRLDTEEPATSAIVDPIAEVRELLRESQAQNRQARRLDQLHRISALVANLRAIAESEAETNGNIQQAAHVPHARKRLELALTTYRVLGGDHELEACETLATGSEITHSQNIVSHAANAFDELVRAAREEEV
ncbi:MAG TPA: hypothetical protein VFM96_05660, partial [Gaiellaceae bacterium]|nr:hypothetical protein [Gaiellaceae bacterium]